MESTEDKFGEYMKESIKSGEVYGRIYGVEDSEISDGSYSVNVSLFNDEMQRADYYFYIAHGGENTAGIQFTPEEEVLFRQYRPYFFEFTAEIRDQQIKDRLIEMKEEYRIVRMYLADPGMYSPGARQNTGEVILEGSVFFSASPIEARRKTLVFNPDSKAAPSAVLMHRSAFAKDSVLRRTEKCEDSVTAFEKFKDKIPDDIRKVKGTVYSVGNANNIRLKFTGATGNSCTWFYDIGAALETSVRKIPEIDKNLNSLKRFKNIDAIILSHWDLDHILAVGYYRPEVIYSEKIVWLAPAVSLLYSSPSKSKTPSLGALRLACYLAEKCDLYLSTSRCFGKKLATGSPTVELWQGDPAKGKKTYNQYVNNIGLMIEVSGISPAFVGVSGQSFIGCPNGFYFSDMRALFCGDVAFEAMPSPLKKKQYNLIVTPHHGSDSTTPDLKGKNDATAIISSYATKGRSFPGSAHVLELVKMGFTHIMITEQKGNINIRMLL